MAIWSYLTNWLTKSEEGKKRKIVKRNNKLVRPEDSSSCGILGRKVYRRERASESLMGHCLQLRIIQLLRRLMLLSSHIQCHAPRLQIKIIKYTIILIIMEPTTNIKCYQSIKHER